MSTALVAIVLLIFKLDYHAYADANAWIVWMLGPATVAFGVGLAKNAKLLRGNIALILVGVIVGISSTTACAIGMGFLMGVPHDLLLAFSMKATTTAVAFDLANTLKINPVIVTITVLVSGMIGAISGPTIFKLLNVKDIIESGVATGSVAHGIGTAQIASDDEAAGAFSGLVMSLGAIFVALTAPIIVNLIGK